MSNWKTIDPPINKIFLQNVLHQHNYKDIRNAICRVKEKILKDRPDIEICFENHKQNGSYIVTSPCIFIADIDRFLVWFKSSKQETCKFCSNIFYPKDSKAKICPVCKLEHDCKCGCGQKVKGPATYAKGHHLKGKTYKEIHGDKIVNCGHRKGELNAAKRQDIRAKISIGVKKSYENNQYYKEKCEHLEKIRCVEALYSKQSQFLFWKIFNLLNEDDKNSCYFGELNREFEKSGDGCSKQQYLYDFVLNNRKKVIEFNGDYWHMNPSKFKETDINEVTKLTTKRTVENDKIKNDFIKRFGFTVLIIWASELEENEAITIQKCIDFLTKETK